MNANQDRVYTCNKFTGVYPTGVAAVVWASDVSQAAFRLNWELREAGLPGDASPHDMREFAKPSEGSLYGLCRVLANGDY